MAASKLTAWLSQATDALYPFTLSPNLGTLTLRWVVPLSHTRLTPDTRSRPLLQLLQVRSLITGSPVSRRLPVFSALPYNTLPWTSACGQFREEPAIASLVWPFSPIPRLHQ
jgi:hypothetical protein